MAEKKDNKEKRFVKVSEQNLSIATNIQVLADRQTGVNYMLVTSGYGVSVTPMLDAQGNPLVGLPRSTADPEF